ncbi:TPA: hypothetical protein N0F65_011552 [Lagenidium giganteum]|uniref:50S ribosomal protein L25 n=1 Tax=Lagenidium giganteum TaxID=4803 RepID=A0AAV2YLG7_9STRA|nr:TPA: hypothetical protein N0F65_011552 [Lagenidium giganteum]
MLAFRRQALAPVALRACFSTTAAAAASASEGALHVIHLEQREGNGSRASRRLRKQGLLPGIIYGEGVDGQSDKKLVALKTRTFEQLHRKLWTSIENQVFEVTVEGEAAPVKVLMRDLQLDPGVYMRARRLVSDLPVSVNFLRYKPGHKVSIPIKYLNEEGSPGLKRGGYINHIHHSLDCFIFTDVIPETLQIDVNGLHVGDYIHLDAISFPEGVVPAIPAGSLVSKIAGRRGLIPRAEPVVEVVEEVEEEVTEKKEKEFDIWNDVF